MTLVPTVGLQPLCKRTRGLPQVRSTNIGIAAVAILLPGQSRPPGQVCIRPWQLPATSLAARELRVSDTKTARGPKPNPLQPPQYWLTLFLSLISEGMEGGPQRSVPAVRSIKRNYLLYKYCTCFLLMGFRLALHMARGAPQNPTRENLYRCRCGTCSSLVAASRLFNSLNFPTSCPRFSGHNLDLPSTSIAAPRKQLGNSCLAIEAMQRTPA